MSTPDIRDVSAITDILASLRRWYDTTSTPPLTLVSQTRIAHASKPPVPAHVLSLRREVTDRLTFWARMVIQERDLNTRLDTDMRQLLDFHNTHADWIAGEPEAPQFIHEIGGLAHRIEEVAKQSRPAKVKIGTCPECGTGLLTATVRKSDDLLPSVITCSDDPEHEWTTWSWQALGRRVTPLHPTGTARLLRALVGDSENPREYGTGRIRDTSRDSA